MLNPDIIIPYDGVHASIPSGWSRDTRFDGRYVKATTSSWGSTGGASTHTHTVSSHTHTYSNNGHTHDTSSTGYFGGVGTVKSDARHKDSPPYDVMTAEHTHWGKTSNQMSSESISSTTPSIGSASNEYSRYLRGNPAPCWCCPK